MKKVDTKKTKNASKKQEKEISVLSYKKAIVGDLISQLVNESKDQLFQIGAMIGTIESDTDEYETQVKCIRNATAKINELYEALNFEAEDEMTSEQFVNTIKVLLKAKLLISSGTLKFDVKNVGIVLNYAKELIYIVVKTIEEFLNVGQKEIICEIEEIENKYLITVFAAEGNFDINEIIGINTCDKLSIEKNNDNKIIIAISK